ncbi:DUF4097 domain-containing protein [Lachnospiraceae bacterium ZAX-1]
MKNFTRICLIISLVAIIIGFTSCAAGVGLGFSFNSFQRLIENDWFTFNIGYIGESFYEEDDLENTSVRGGDNWIQNETAYDAEKVKSFDLEINGGKIVIEETQDEEIGVEVEYRSIFGSFTRNIKSELDNHTLKICDTNKRKWIRQKNAYVTIRVPEGIQFNRIDMEIGAGVIQLDTSLHAKDIHIEVGAGELISKKVQLTADKSLNLSVGTGNVSLYHAAANKMKIHNGVGETKVKEATAQKISINNGVGNVDIRVSGKESDYSYKISAGIGGVEVGDGNHFGFGADKVIKNDASNDVEIESGIGAVKLSFSSDE